MRWVVVLVFVIAVCAPLSACGSSSSASQKGVLAPIVSVALAQKSVHWTERTSADLSGAENETSDVAAHSGDQRFDYDGAKVEFRLVDDVVYFRGNVAGLSGPSLSSTSGGFVPWLRLTKARAERYTGQWISIPKGDKFYARAADRVTLASLIHDEIPQATASNLFLKTVTKWSHGTKLRVLQAMDKYGLVYESLSAHAGGDRLLVGTSDFSGPGSGADGHFSRWNEPVHVQAPASSIPIATVRRG